LSLWVMTEGREGRCLVGIIREPPMVNGLHANARSVVVPDILQG